MIKCKGKPRIDPSSDGVFVSIKISDEHQPVFLHPTPLIAPFSDTVQGDIRKKFVGDWCSKNCSGSFEIYGRTTMHFGSMEDAVLFYLHFGN